MSFQFILRTTVSVILLFAGSQTLLAQPFAPVAENTRFVPASGVPRVAALPGPARSQTNPNRQVLTPQTLDNSVYEPTTVLATVGSEYILAGDLMPQVEIVMWLMFKERSQEELERHKKEIDAQKQVLLRNLL